jgi:regulator of protease activity HflC (stomatin/prohibitin superfamily)
MTDQQALNHTGERPASTASGGLMLLVAVVSLAAGIMMFSRESVAGGILGGLLVFFGVFVIVGLYTIQPNQAAAITVFGAYAGTDRKTGLRWVLPWYARKKLSLRVRNVTSEKLKVNDKRGNPIEIAANIVWRVTDSAQALFDVDDYSSFVDIQIETALREVARQYAYDHGEEDEATLRTDADEVGERLRQDLQARISVAGLTVDEAHLMHLAYAPEIAGAMLRRQQAEAVLAARTMIVTGAVKMVESALEQLAERKVVVLDDERRAAMVSNLLVVLCADREAQPVVNAGTLYS